MRMALFAGLLLAGTMAIPASAQQAAPALGGRVDKLEKEMRAVQRKVFPGANPAYFEAEIAPPAAPATAPGTPASSPITDLGRRVDALEQELSRITGQIEQNSFKLRQIEDAMTRFRGDAEFRLNTLEGKPTAPAAGAAAASPAPAASAPAPAPAAASPAPPAAPAPAPAPSTGDPAEDGYMAGYRLWEAKKYAEAEILLKEVVAKYPKHKRASYAQNLLGRSYLDGGKPAMAAEAFYSNYQKMPRGERAPDSLYFLGQALVQLKKPAEACKVYDELRDVYGATIAEPLKSRVSRARADAKCTA